MSICETISSFFSKYFSSHDHQMFDHLGKKLMYTTRSYGEYVQSVVQSVVQSGDIQIYSCQPYNFKGSSSYEK